MMHPLSSVRADDPVVAFFTSLGYQVDWDKRGDDSWYEILEGGHLVAQIDMDAPLADIREDMTAWHDGREGTSKSDYKVNLPKGAASDRLLKRVAQA